MRTQILNKPSLEKQAGVHSWRYRWAALAGVLGTLSVALAQEPPTITRQPTNLDLSVGATAMFRVYVGGTAPYGYQWHYTNSGNSIALDGAVNPSALTASLNLTNVQSADAGGYFVVVTNVAGSATSQVATLTLDPTFIKITTGPVVTDDGNSIFGSWGDYDNDGFVDLFVANAAWNGAAQTSFLHHNSGDGTFTRVTNGALVTVTRDLNSGGWTDYDNDGLLDLFAANYGANNDLRRIPNARRSARTAPGRFLPFHSLVLVHVTLHSFLWSVTPFPLKSWSSSGR